MANALIVHVLVGVLLACPFPCLANATGTGAVRATGHCADGGCCCSNQSPKSHERGPAAPERGNGGTCLCHGALMDRLVSPPGMDLQFVAIVSDDDLIHQHRMVVIEDRLWLNPSACDFASVGSGRMLRAHIESLLI